jgi:hypothetical protein
LNAGHLSNGIDPQSAVAATLHLLNDHSQGSTLTLGANSEAIRPLIPK